MPDKEIVPQLNIKRGMRWHMMVAMVGIIMTMIVMLTVLQVSAQKDSLNNALAAHSSFLQEQVHKKASKASKKMSLQIERLVSTYRIRLTDTYINNVIKDIDDLKYVILVEGKKAKSAIGSDLVDSALREYILSGEISAFAAMQTETMHHDFTVGNHAFMESVVPIMVNQKQWGVVRLGFSVDELNENLATSRLRNHAAIAAALTRASVTSLLFLILGAFGVYYFARRWTDPIQKLVHFSHKLANGDFSATAHISSRNDDEIGLLAASLEDMAESLKHSYAQLEEHSHTLEDKVEKRTRELAEARDKALAATRTKSDFLANMSHEIRTPMNAVIGMTHLARDGATDSSQRQYLDKILTASENLLQIINDILDFSKVEAGKMELDPADFYLQETLDHVDSVAAIQAHQKGLEFIVDVPADIPMLHGDSLRLGQVLLNLVSNAVKFTQTGYVQVKISPIQQSDTGIDLRFNISDSGIGMSEDQMAHLFEAFTQADASTTRNYGGTGLGLAICKQMVNLMQGEFTVESAPDQGSSFQFDIHFGLGDANARALFTAGNNAPSNNMQALQGAHVLLVEDNEINQQVADGLLSKAGVNLHIVHNGKQAVGAVKSKAFDAVLMDMQMPVMDGLTATRLIRADGAFAQLPIIAMTANAMSADQQACIDAGMNDHISKPIDPGVLYNTLARWITHSASNEIDLSGSAASNTQPDDIEFSGLQGIDIDDGLQRLADDKQLYRQILCSFRDSQGDSIQRMQVAVAADDYASAGSIAHILKGLAGNIGAKVLMQQIATLESALSTGEPVDDNIWETAEMQLTTITESLSGLCATVTPEDQRHEKSVDRDTVNNLIDQMRLLLEDYDGDAVDLLDELSVALGDSNTQHISSLRQHLAAYDFDAALTNLNAITLPDGNEI
ncbi:MAG: ATP-binding protein [Mariprofundus sp.]|nr:ATP-binding protein [Mariprofundus sp.]